MFVLSQSGSFTWPVKVQLPVSGGKFETQTFDAEFKRLPKSRIDEVILLIEKDEIRDTEFCKEVLVGWKGIQDDKGQEVPFSESARDQLLEVPVVAGALVHSFFGAITGGKLKN